jgi:hypothetical protein
MDDCPICFLPLLHSLNIYMTCCGKTICNGCAVGYMENSPGCRIAQAHCPFCRQLQTENDHVNAVEMLNNQIARNDIQSFVELGEFE